MKHRYVILLAICAVLVSGILFAQFCGHHDDTAKQPWRPADTVRVMAYASTAACPAPQRASGGQWRYGNVFTPAPGVTLPRDMARLCFYEWVPGKAGQAADRAKLPAAGLGPLVDDPVVLGASTTVTQPSLPALEANFINQIEPPTFPIPAGTAVTLGIADSSPTTPTTGAAGSVILPGASQHGFNIGWIAEQISCVGGTCAVPSTQLVLPRYTNPDGTMGYGAPSPTPGAPDLDVYGTTTELAQGIIALVDRWYATRPGSHLIINLSIGWEPNSSSGCDDPGQPSASDKGPALPGPNGFVRTALAYAACSGALVVAAGGNVPGAGQCASGPTCPALWAASWAEPQGSLDQECKALRDLQPLNGKGRFSASPTRLLYAVGALDYGAQPLVPTRDHGFPVLAAPGLHGVMFPPPPPSTPVPITAATAPTEPSPYTRDLSGTSVSTAVVSGIAAAVWAQNPTLDAAGVMTQIQTSAAVLPVSATFCDIQGGPCPHAERAGLCSALSALNANGAPCAYTHNEQVYTPAQARQILGAIEPVRTSPRGTPLSITTVPSCTSHVTPQPGQNPCPSCALAIISLYLEVTISRTWPDSALPLSNTTLRYYDSGGSLVASFNWPNPSLTDNESWTFPVSSAPPAGGTATVQFTYDNNSYKTPEESVALNSD